MRGELILRVGGAGRRCLPVEHHLLVRIQTLALDCNILVRVDRHKDGTGTGVNIIPVVTNTKGVEQARLRHVGEMQDIR